MPAAVASPTAPKDTPRIVQHMGLAAALAAVADGLFFRRPVGISLALFLTLVFAVATISARGRYSLRRIVFASGIIGLAILPLVEDINTLSLTFGLIGMASAAIILFGGFTGAWADRLGEIAGFYRGAPAIVAGDMISAARAVSLDTRRVRSGVVVWTVPVALGLVFFGLFVSANPLIERELGQLLTGSPKVELSRIAFWLAAMVAVWPFIVPRVVPALALPCLAQPSCATEGTVAREPTWLSEASILRSLLVFNVLFAFETALDTAYLWHGRALPEGMTYASYAHRGAYPLMAAALLAGAFVLAAFKAEGGRRPPLVLRALLTAWIAQTIFLVASSIFRLDLYVAVYALSYWRVCAFIWMGLVAVGLALLLARVLTARSNRWLIGSNAAALVATLYACCFVDFAAIIADYNVGHSREMTGEAQNAAIDWGYLAQLGPAAYPALLRLPAGHWQRARTVTNAEVLVASYDATASPAADWRGWTMRSWRRVGRLRSALAAPVPPAPPLPGDAQK